MCVSSTNRYCYYEHCTIIHYIKAVTRETSILVVQCVDAALVKVTTMHAYPK
jgi:hypothetical protein